VKLPNAERAIVEREKITEYLLNPTHRYGASKARFFADFGFHLDNRMILADADVCMARLMKSTVRRRRRSGRDSRSMLN
jgi:hypothetical protein